jgi:hypothetical protein
VIRSCRRDAITEVTRRIHGETPTHTVAGNPDPFAPSLGLGGEMREQRFGVTHDVRGTGRRHHARHEVFAEIGISEDLHPVTRIELHAIEQVRQQHVVPAVRDALGNLHERRPHADAVHVHDHARPGPAA